MKVWKPAEPYLKYGMSEGARVYGGQRGSPFYNGDLYANMDPNAMKAVMENAQRLTGSINPAVSSLAGVGSNFLGNASGDLMSRTMNNLSDPNGANAAGYSLANSGMADGLVSAANRDVARNLNENELPGARLAAMGTGNINSSRLGAREAILQRGAEDRMADTSAGIRGDMYDRGVSNFNTNVGQSQQMLGQMFNQGLGAYQGAAGLAQQSGDAMQQAAAFQQGDSQGELDALFKQWQGGDQRSWDLLNRYWAMAGGNLGSSTSGGSKSSSFSLGFS